MKYKLEQRCDGNPYVIATPLRNIVSSALIPEKAKEHILNLAKIGQERYTIFVQDRLLLTSQRSIWDKITKLKLKSFSNWMTKSRITVGDKVVKLREERQLLARFLVIQQSRPELVPKLGTTIGDFEMSVVPRSIFAVDGSLLLCKDKSSLMNAIEKENKKIVDLEMSKTTAENPVPTSRVLIIDAMAVLQSMKKVPGMMAILDLKEAFLMRIRNMANTYDEIRIAFDHYLMGSLKAKTRLTRSTSVAASQVSYDIHDKMSIKTLSLKELFSSSQTKNDLSKLLSEALLKYFHGSSKKYVLSYHTFTRVNYPHTIPDSFLVHCHEEADTLILLHVIDSLSDNTFREVHVRSPDTDVFILLMDLTANGYLGILTVLKFCTGTGSNYREIDIRSCVKVVGEKKSRALIGFHIFSGADWGGKFVGISKKTWTETFLSLENNDDIIACFSALGTIDLSQATLQDGELPTHLKSIEIFVCQTYFPKGPMTLPSLRWELFRSRNLEAEMLPPTRGTLLPHIMRTNFVSMRDKSYVTPMPILPKLELNGCSMNENIYIPVKSLLLPAPRAVLELVKCGCRISCCGNCSCLRHNLPCTPLCKCYSSGCEIYSDKTKEREHNEDEDGEDELF